MTRNFKHYVYRIINDRQPIERDYFGVRSYKCDLRNDNTLYNVTNPHPPDWFSKKIIRVYSDYEEVLAFTTKLCTYFKVDDNPHIFRGRIKRKTHCQLLGIKPRASTPKNL
jgi:hypothetical protein